VGKYIQQGVAGIKREAAEHRRAAIVGKNLDAGSVDQNVELNFLVNRCQIGCFASAGKGLFLDVVDYRRAAEFEADLACVTQFNFGLDFKEFAGYSAEQIFPAL